MVWCDKNENVLQWGSEEIVIPYISPVDRRVHRYFPDFYVKAKTRDERIKKYIVEVKPEKQCQAPKRPKRLVFRIILQNTLLLDGFQAKTAHYYAVCII